MGLAGRKARILLQGLARVHRGHGNAWGVFARPKAVVRRGCVSYTVFRAASLRGVSVSTFNGSPSEEGDDSSGSFCRL